MSDYKVKEVRPAQTVGEKVIPAVHEITFMANAIDEEGKTVRIEARKMMRTVKQIDDNIAQFETELAKWKAIKADIQS